VAIARFGGDSEVYSYSISPECSDENPWPRAHTICYASTSVPVAAALQFETLDGFPAPQIMLGT
jgi:hypothetical protein